MLINNTNLDIISFANNGTSIEFTFVTSDVDASKNLILTSDLSHIEHEGSIFNGYTKVRAICIYYDEITTMSVTLEYATDQSRIEEIEKRLDEITYQLKKVSDNVTEVIKKDDSEMPSGTYLHPIKYVNSMSVTAGLWYYLDDVELPYECIKSGVPVSFKDTEFFDVISI